MKIKVGRLHEQADGGKVFITFEDQKGIFYGCAEQDAHIIKWDKTGLAIGEYPEYNLKGLWSEREKRKPKVGDRVLAEFNRNDFVGVLVRECEIVRADGKALIGKYDGKYRVRLVPRQIVKFLNKEGGR